MPGTIVACEGNSAFSSEENRPNSHPRCDYILVGEADEKQGK